MEITFAAFFHIHVEHVYVGIVAIPGLNGDLLHHVVDKGEVVLVPQDEEVL